MSDERKSLTEASATLYMTAGSRLCFFPVHAQAWMWWENIKLPHWTGGRSWTTAMVCWEKSDSESLDLHVPNLPQEPRSCASLTKIFIKTWLWLTLLPALGYTHVELWLMLWLENRISWVCIYLLSSHCCFDFQVNLVYSKPSWHRPP